MAWSRFLRRRRWDAERAAELQDYLAHEVDDNLARGLTRDEAVRAAYVKLGNVTLIREEIYRMNTLQLFEDLLQDLRYGARLLLRDRTFALVAILTLAVGAGANAAMFQLMNAVRLRTLPVARPGDLVHVGIDTQNHGRTGTFWGRRPFFTEPLYRALAAEQQGFSHLIAWSVTSWNTGTDGEYVRADGLYVGGSYFEGLAVRPHVGRLIAPGDDLPGCGAPGAVLSHGFWQERFGGRPDALGRTVTLDGRMFEIIGVTPPEFFGTEVGRTFDAALPLCAEPLIRPTESGLGRRDTWFLDIMGRLAPGWSAEGAQAQLDAISPGVFAATVPASYTPENARNYAAFRFTVTPAPTGVSGVRRAYATQLWVLLGATGLVLLITCANLANLMLARATARTREIAVRLAIGASRRRVVRQLLSESLLIAALGALCGVLLAQWLSAALVAFLSTESSRLFVDLSPDWRVLTFVVAVAVAACLLFGLSPALQATAVDPGSSMHAGGRSGTDSEGRLAFRRALVVVQVALSTVLIVGALLFARSLHNLRSVDPGFRQDGIVAMTVDLRRASIDPASGHEIYRQILERIRSVPGIERASEVAVVPLSGSVWNQTILIGGERQEGIVNFNSVGTEYFTTMGTPLVTGRRFGAEDRAGTPFTAIVNGTFARRYFPGSSPIGQTFQIETGPDRPRESYEIVGVVEDTKYTDLREEHTPIAYLPMAQDTEGVGPSVNLVARTTMAPSAMRPALTRAVREAVPGATVAYATLQTYIRNSLVTERLMASLSAFFGALALTIATIGLYGVMSYTVSRRRVEIGVRMALGADPRLIVRMVLGQSGRLLAIGLLAGGVLAVFASRWAAGLLFGLAPWDAASIGVAAAVLGAVSLLAAWIPARRASRMEPTVALRSE